MEGNFLNFIGSTPCQAYLFPIAAVINHNKLWFKIRKKVFSYSYRGLKSEMGLTGLKPRCWQGCLSLETRENPFPHTFTSFKELPVFLGSRLPSRMASL